MERDFQKFLLACKKRRDFLFIFLLNNHSDFSSQKIIFVFSKEFNININESIVDRTKNEMIEENFM